MTAFEDILIAAPDWRFPVSYLRTLEELRKFMARMPELVRRGYCPFWN